MSDFDDELEQFERQVDRDPLDFFEEEPRPEVREGGQTVRILGSESAEEPAPPPSAPYDAVADDDWPPRSGLGHRFPSIEEDDFWGERTTPEESSWATSSTPADPEPEPDRLEWSETSSHESSSATEALPVDASGPIALPHWTEPPTGEIPRVVIGADDPDGAVDEELESWASVTGQTPRYRTEASDWAESDFADPEALKDDSFDVGALSEPEPVIDDDAEFEEQVAARRRGFRGSRAKSRRAATAPAPETASPRPERPRPRRPALERGDTMPPPESSPGGPGVDLTTRVLTGVAIAVVALIMFKLGRGPAAFLVAVIVGVGAFELYEAFRRAGYHPATILGVLGSMAIVGVAYDRGLDAFPLITALVVVFTMLWYMAEVVKARPVVNIAITLFVFMYVGVLGAFGGLLLTSPDGTGLLLGVAICAVGYDVVGYLVGSQFGRSRMAPRLSPNKTWEGLFGGMLASLVLGGIVSAFLTPWDDSLTDGLALGLVVAIVAPIGDLCESMIKRDLGIKDLGTILPGHGGFLDRFDAILFCLPAVYYLVVQLGIG